jgi:SAM-dependent methyltransferase
MSACCCHAQSAGRFFSFFAQRSRKRYQRKGFEASQKQLIAGLEQASYGDASVLDIGCGVGHLHQTLLERGARSAIGIDLAPRMVAEARDWAKQRGLSERVSYIEGDFMARGDIDTADIALLDKVVCCYPDAHGLVEKSLAKTRHLYGLTYPRDRWFVRLGVGVMACLLWLLRSDFRSYVHDPVQIERWITDRGFRKRFEAQTAIWLTQVYEKS